MESWNKEPAGVRKCTRVRAKEEKREYGWTKKIIIFERSSSSYQPSHHRHKTCTHTHTQPELARNSKKVTKKDKLLVKIPKFLYLKSSTQPSTHHRLSFSLSIGINSHLISYSNEEKKLFQHELMHALIRYTKTKFILEVLKIWDTQGYGCCVRCRLSTIVCWIFFPSVLLCSHSQWNRSYSRSTFHVCMWVSGAGDVGMVYVWMANRQSERGNENHIQCSAWRTIYNRSVLVLLRHSITDMIS